MLKEERKVQKRLQTSKKALCWRRILEELVTQQGLKISLALKFQLILILSSDHRKLICKHLELKTETDSMCGERRNNAFILKNKKGNDTYDMIILSDIYVR